MAGKKTNRKSAHRTRGFAAEGNGNSQIAQEFQKHLDEHDWAKAVRTWKQVTTGQSSTRAHQIETLKQLIYEGRDHMQGGLHNQAAACYCKALVIDPRNLDCLRNLVIVDQTAGKHEQALDLINQALSIRTDIASLWCVKVQCLGSLGREAEAQAAIDEACHLGLERNTLLLDLCTRLVKDKPDDAIKIARSLLQNAGPETVSECISLIGICRQYACFELEKKIDWWEATDRIDPSLVPSIALNLQPLAGSIEDNKSLSALVARYGDWCREQCLANPLPELPVAPIEARRIRIGIVSGDFCNHVVARFLLPLLEALDSERFELVCLSTRSRVDDDTRRRFEAIASVVDVAGCQPRAVAEQARAQHLDLCIDAAGFTAYSASQAFAWRMAPLQLNMIGYPGSTFVPNMDLLLSDPVLKPDHDWMHSEELLSMEGLAYCMEPPDPGVPITETLPQIEHGFINFGILVNPYKFHQETIRLWADVLKATPNSQMAIVRPECRSLSFQANILSEFAKNGIPANRVIIVNNHGRNIHHLDCYNKIDVVLDSMPMTGGTSTYEAVLMGLPVITMDGPSYHQRISRTILHHAGLADCIANTNDEYVGLASAMAQNLERLRALRQQAHTLRLALGGLCDGAAYARRFEKALLEAFDRRRLLGGTWTSRLTILHMEG